MSVTNRLYLTANTLPEDFAAFLDGLPAWNVMVRHKGPHRRIWQFLSADHARSRKLPHRYRGVGSVSIPCALPEQMAPPFMALVDRRAETRIWDPRSLVRARLQHHPLDRHPFALAKLVDDPKARTEQWSRAATIVDLIASGHLPNRRRHNGFVSSLIRPARHMEYFIALSAFPPAVAALLALRDVPVAPLGGAVAGAGLVVAAYLAHLRWRRLPRIGLAPQKRWLVPLGRN